MSLQYSSRKELPKKRNLFIWQQPITGIYILQLVDALPVNTFDEAEDIAQRFLYLMRQQFGNGQNIIIDDGAVLI